MDRFLPVALVLALCPLASGQAVLSGRLLQPRAPGSAEMMAMSGVYAAASKVGPESQAVAFRTWETHPTGWWRLGVGSGNHTVLFTTPGYFMRPVVRTNQWIAPGEAVDQVFTPMADYAVFDESAWDRRAAHAYLQPFVARGTSLTHVGFRVASDGVDGGGPGAQDLVVSIHRKTDGPMGDWPQVGPAVAVVGVDSGGAKNYQWSAGWNSGEAPLVPGQTYAVRIAAEKPGAGFQPFWQPTADVAQRCGRVDGDAYALAEHRLWMSVGTDSDRLLIPYNKRVQRQFGELTRFGRKWSQTYVAQGRSLAGVVLYAAVSGVQPPLARQRIAVRLRRGGPDGPVVGAEKIAIGNGNWTGDASWGVFCCAYAPGEVALEKGQAYAIEFETIETPATIGGFINKKNQPNDARPGFNPYRKHPRDGYEQGAAWYNGAEKMDYDLDMQVIEYANAYAGDWSAAVDDKELVEAPDLEAEDAPAAWQPFVASAGTSQQWAADTGERRNRFLRVSAERGKAADGGYVQRIDGLSAKETYRLAARVRSSWAVDDQHSCSIGYDPTGQTDDPRAATIAWAAMPDLSGRFVTFVSSPIRPKKDAISVWLRGRSPAEEDFPFTADFDDISLRRVRTDAP